MRTKRFPRWLLLVVGLTLVLAACGTDGETAGGQDDGTTSSSAMDDMADGSMADGDARGDSDHQDGDDDDDSEHEDGDHQDGGHGHGLLEWDGGTVPTVTLQVIEDPVSGWNVFAAVTGYTFAPVHASSDHVPGEGHAHIEVDGHKIARVYGTAFHIASLAPGMHEVSFQLAANSHDNYAVGGEPLRAVAMVEVPDAMDDGHHHDHGDHAVWDGSETPTVAVDVHKDAVGGWNLFTEVTGFGLTPENASTDHVAGEGHMHIYVNGEKLTRLYTPAYHIGELPAGDLHIEVRLSSNDHREYMLDGAPVAGSAMITVSEGDGTMTENGHDHDDGDMVEADHVIMVTFADGAVVGDLTRHEVSVGDVVEIMVTADISDEVHVHGYDVVAPVTPDSPAVLRLTAAVPGIFEVELEMVGDLLFELVVS